MGHAVEQQHFGARWYHCLREAFFDGDAGVLLSVDEEDGDVELGQGAQARGAHFHSALGGEDAFFARFEALVTQLFDVLGQVFAFRVGEEVGDEVDDESGAVEVHLAAHFVAAGALVGVVGHSVRVEQGQSLEHIAIAVGEGQGDVSAQRVAGHNALVDAGVVEDGFDGVGHKVHRVYVGVGGAVAVAWQIDGDDTHRAHIGQCERAPNAEILQKTVQQDECLGVFATFVAIV